MGVCLNVEGYQDLSLLSLFCFSFGEVIAVLVYLQGLWNSVLSVVEQDEA